MYTENVDRKKNTLCQYIEKDNATYIYMSMEPYAKAWPPHMIQQRNKKLGRKSEMKIVMKMLVYLRRYKNNYYHYS